MSDKKPVSIKKNMIMNAILTMSTFIFPLITFPYVSRILHTTGTGRIDFANSAVSYFAMFAQLGIPNYGVKAVAKVRDDKDKLTKVVHELLIINLIMTVLVYIVFGFSINLIPRFRRDRALFIVCSTIMFLNAIGIEWMYKGLEKYSYITSRSVIFKFIGIIAMFLMVKSEDDYIIYGGITIFATAASDILNFINARKYISFKPRHDYNLKQHRGPVLIFFSMSIATTIYTKLDSVMLGFMKGDMEVGLYGAAVKIKNILMGIVTSASMVLLPRASSFVQEKKMTEFYRILTKTMHLIILMAVPFAVYFVMYARDGITFLSGLEYEGATIPMIIMMPTLILIGITNVSGIQMMVPLGMEKQVFYSEIVGAVTDLILNAILIPKFSVAGAAVGTLIAEIGVTIYQMWIVRNQPVKLFEEISLKKLIPAALIPIAGAYWIRNVQFTSGVESNSLLRLICSAIIFFMMYGVILIIAKDELVLEILESVLFKLKRKAGKNS